MLKFDGKQFYGGVLIDPKDQPTLEEKLQVLNGADYPKVWDYLFAVPDVSHAYWTAHHWVEHIGNKWFRKVPR